MVQIEKKRKKGRPSKADLAARRAAVEDVGVSPSAVEGAAAEEDEREVRRSLRRRSFRYNIIDYDEDYLDEDDVVTDDDDGGGDDDESNKRRRGKKVKLVVKLSNSSNGSRRSSKRSNHYNNSSTRTSYGSVSRLGRVAASDGESEDDEREVKKRRIHEDDVDEESDNGENEDDDYVNGDVQGRDAKDEVKAGDFDGEDDDYVPGLQNGNTSSKRSSSNNNTPLPDKKQLDLILDKLQKKDTYGVYSEPVDPEELPDYHDVIEHPMDFSTVRKKLVNGAYSTLEQFETDVFLISSNAMQYNSSDTVYYRQASAIKELAEKKFERLRMQIEQLEKELQPEAKSETKVEPKSEQKERPYPFVKKQTKKPFSRGTQEPVGSDFSAGATLATVHAPIICSADHAGNFENLINNDGPLEGVSSPADNILEKAEDPQSGKGVIPKFGKRIFVVDENCRATYNISNQPEEKPETVFMTFDSEKKQLIPVGLSGELSYARSLARYAANLGPMAWRIASTRIEQVIPPGFKYGRGWIGEYEPLPTPVLFFEHRKDPFASRLHNPIDSRNEDRKDPVFPRSHDAVDSKKDEKFSECRAQANVHLFNPPCSDGKLTASFGSGSTKPPISTLSVCQQKNPPTRGSEDRIFKGAESNSPSLITQQNIPFIQQQNSFARDNICLENTGAKRLEPNSLTIVDQKRDCFPQKQHSHGTETGKKRIETNTLSTSDQKNEKILQKQPPHRVEIQASKPSESLPMGKNFLQSPLVKQPDANGGVPDRLSNGRVANNFVGSSREITSSQGFMSGHLAGAPVSFPIRQDQGLSDPVLVMKMMTEAAQRQQNGSIHVQTPTQNRPSAPSPRGDTGGSAAQAAASAWMSIGSGGFRPPAQNSPTVRSQISTDSLCNATTRMFYPQAMQSHVEYPGVLTKMHFQPEKLGLPSQSIPSQPTKVGNEAQVPSRPTVFPQLVPNDLSRFQVQSPWRGLSPHTQQKQKTDTLPPDLNVAFQASVDSQQPDLALQL